MGYFVTGGSGFIGRHVVEELLLHRRGPIRVLVRETSLDRFDFLHRTRWRSSRRITPVTGDLTAPVLGIEEPWAAAHAADVTHFFHLAALYDMSASSDRNEQLNIGGTREAVGLAAALRAKTFHHLSSVAVAGDYQGVFDETMFDQGQELPSPYHKTMYESERVVRTQCVVPWRIYRPAIVLGHSETGAMDEIDGPYYFFPLLKRLRDSLPQWAPLLGVDLGDTNVVPVDYVARAIVHLAHQRGLDGRTFHLINRDPQFTVEVINTLATAAKAPRFAVPVQPRFVRALPPSLAPINLLTSLLRTPAAQPALDQTIGRLGIPPEVLGHLSLPSTFASRHTEQALADSDVECPDLGSYAAVLWDYWEQHLDPTTANDSDLRDALLGRTAVITGASSSIGKATALKVAQAGGVPLLVARGTDGLLETRVGIEAAGGVAYVYSCDLADLGAIDRLAKKIVAEHGQVDYIVDNPGGSIRGSPPLSVDHFHDLELTMQLHYFAAIRLVMDLLSAMQGSTAGHVVNISSIGVQGNPQRFSAHVASKAALDAWSRVVSSELVGDGVTFTTIHMPPVKTPMTDAPTTIEDAFPTISPAMAADLVMRALKNRPHEINAALGTAGEVAHALLPTTAFQLLHRAYQVFQGSSATGGDESSDR